MKKILSFLCVLGVSAVLPSEVIACGQSSEDANAAQRAREAAQRAKLVKESEEANKFVQIKHAIVDASGDFLYIILNSSLVKPIYKEMIHFYDIQNKNIKVNSISNNKVGSSNITLSLSKSVRPDETCEIKIEGFANKEIVDVVNNSQLTNSSIKIMSAFINATGEKLTINLSDALINDLQAANDYTDGSFLFKDKSQDENNIGIMSTSGYEAGSKVITILFYGKVKKGEICTISISGLDGSDTPQYSKPFQCQNNSNVK